MLKNLRAMELAFLDEPGRAQADVDFDLEKVSELVLLSFNV